MTEAKKTFRKGDRVVSLASVHQCSPKPDPDRVYTVKDVHPLYDGVYLEELAPHLWYRADHFKPVEPVTRVVPGVPEGYRLVRIGKPKQGELYLDWVGHVVKAPSDYSGLNHVVLEKTTKTERLWVWVDKTTGEATDVWLLEGDTPGAEFNISKVLTSKLREVPA